MVVKFLSLILLASLCNGKQVLKIEKTTRHSKDYFKIESYTGPDETELQDDVTYDSTEVNVEGSEFYQIPENFFKVFNNATSVKIYGVGLRFVRQSDFQDARSLKFLYLRHNKIESLPEFAFVHLRNLESLGLNSNRLSGLHPSVFGGLDKLEKLDLEANRITQLPAELFVSLTSLEILTLDKNKIQTLPDNLFAYNKKLKHLSLRDCGLTQTHPDVFRPLINLETINFGENQITSIPIDLFVDNSKLEEIAFHKCGLQHIPAYFFTKFANLKEVQISYNSLDEIFLPKLTTLYCAECNLKELHINGTAMYLWLGKNQLKTVHIQSLELTRTIDLKNNLVEDLEFLKPANALRVLDLSGNPINPTQLTRDVFSQKTNLDFLDLSSAQLPDFIHSDVFVDLASLTFLNLSNNHIQNLDINLFTPLKNLESLHINNNNLNNFDCDGLQRAGIKARVKNCI